MFLADLHIHSRFSRATSKDLNLTTLYRAAVVKGLTVLGTGDVTHPGWLAEIEERLTEAEDGLFALREEYLPPTEAIPAGCRGREVRFMLTGEVSNIYKRGGKVRKIHHVITLPSFQAAHRLAERLERIGNIRSDGRPILGLDSRDLLEIVLETDPRAYLIPAHIWTPWFSMFGSRSGFDSMEECFGDLVGHVFAVETGLSSDPPMNWRVSDLDRVTLVSNSDAHSPGKLGREANLFDCALGYGAMFDALRTRAGFLGTVEFYPEEGKYHLDGHRKCDVRLDPEESLALGNTCPVCGQPLTIGVLHRVVELADRPPGYRPEDSPGFSSLVPLPEIIGEIMGRGPATKGVMRSYEGLLTRLGPELTVLLETPLDLLEREAGDMVSEAIRRMRAGEVVREAGFDGEYGRIRLFRDDELGAAGRGRLLFPLPEAETPRRGRKPRAARAQAGGHPGEGRVQEGRASQATEAQPTADEHEVDAWRGLPAEVVAWLRSLNPSQLDAVLAGTEHPLLVVAGPGTGKTRTLTTRLARLISSGEVGPDQILALTFTVKAARELGERLVAMVGEAPFVGTFHSLCHAWLSSRAAAFRVPEDFVVLDADASKAAYAMAADLTGHPRRSLDSAVKEIGLLRARGVPRGGAGWTDRLASLHREYERLLAAWSALDYTHLVERVADGLSGDMLLRQDLLLGVRVIAVDEYQDVDPLQVGLLRLMASQGAHLFAIGDPDQAIYGFRGADPTHITGFREDWPSAEVITLSRSYRSTDTILEAGRQVLGPGAGSPALESGIVGERLVTIREAPTERAEAEAVVHMVEQALGGTGFFSMDSGRVGHGPGEGLSFGDVAVLFRLHSLAEPLVEAFERSGIPYQVAGGRSSPAARLRLLAQTCLRVVRHPNPADLSLVRARYEVMAGHAIEPERFVEALRGLGDQKMVLDLLSEALPDMADRLQALRNRFSGSEGGALELLDDQDDLDPRAQRVSLMTIHAAKGLEFELVFVVGCEEGLLPHLLPGDEDPGRVAEERRLMYVAMTRAKRWVVLTHARSRERTHPRSRRPSRFLDSIDASLKAIERSERRGRRQVQLSLF